MIAKVFDIKIGEEDENEKERIILFNINIE